MTRQHNHSAFYLPAPPVPLDLRDCYTGSFAEFIPFCRSLYCIANFKDFSTAIPA